MPAITASAPAKTILYGEHAVVYGQPAIAVPVRDLRTKVTIQALPGMPANHVEIISEEAGVRSFWLQLPQGDPLRISLDLFLRHFKLAHLMAMRIIINSDIPYASGLGSGASVSVALFNALAAFCGLQPPPEEINHLAFEIEKLHHGTPSGIDNTVIAFDSAIYYQHDHPMEMLKIGQDLHFMLIDTGVRSSTVQAVSDVRSLLNRYPDLYSPIISEIGSISQEAKTALALGDAALLGQLMQRNQALLRKLNVSHPAIDLLVAICEHSGALGAKLSGAGRGGHVISLLGSPENKVLAENLGDNGFYNFRTFTLARQTWSD